jgi:hypothetical protein
MRAVRDHVRIGLPGCFGPGRTAIGLALALALGCAKVGNQPPSMGKAGTGGGGGAAGTGMPDPPSEDAAGFTPPDAGSDATDDGASMLMPIACTGLCVDFPEEPILAPGTPAAAPTMFKGPAMLGAGPCITEPEDGALFPSNWLRPRVKAKGATPGSVREIRVHADREANDLVVYTTADTWVMPAPIWINLASHVRDQPITVTVREQGHGASTVTFTIAPVPATGSVVYWAADPAEKGSTKPAVSSSLKGFAVGAETVGPVLGVRDVQMQTRAANFSLRNVTCIGCHSSTPDGESVAFVDNYPWSMAVAEVKPGRTGLVPDYVTQGGLDALRQPGLGIFSFSWAHWQGTDRLAVAPYYLDAPCGQYKQTSSNVRLAWLNLAVTDVMNGCPVEGKHFGIIARTGDDRGAAMPTWSHDGQTIVYASAPVGHDGRLEMGPSDLYQVPFNDGAGGPATPLPFAADPGSEEYYPSFSPDDELVVFDRVPVGDFMYANPNAELFVVPAKDATQAVRLAANDPPKCSGLQSPGVNNHWAKWSPGLGSPGQLPAEIPSKDGRTYYWLIFSSNRYGSPPVRAKDGSMVQVSQLYMTAVVASETGLQTYPAIYLWNQNTATLNTTPAWDSFKIPTVE